MTRTTTLIRLLLGAVLCMAAALLSACSGGDANKAGASAEHTVTLTLQMPDAGDPQGVFFARAVERRSGGSVRIRVDSSRYPSGTPARELALARALKAGREDMGYVPARAWAADGDGAFKALLAP